MGLVRSKSPKRTCPSGCGGRRHRLWKGFFAGGRRASRVKTKNRSRSPFGSSLWAGCPSYRKTLPGCERRPILSAKVRYAGDARPTLRAHLSSCMRAVMATRVEPNLKQITHGFCEKILRALAGTPPWLIRITGWCPTDHADCSFI